MITFKNNNLAYIPSVDLTTLGNTFNTLEEGHKKAIQTASELENTIAKLEMDESESDFKEGLIADIQNTIDNNTIYGNAYGSLDDLIMKAGNISSRGDVIGRIKSYAAKKEYDAKVDAAAIPDAMKEMYKKENPYYYTDGEIDERTGRVKMGEIWKPTTTPVKTVAQADIQKQALAIAATDEGQSNSISFLDANGRPTYRPEESVDGLIYQKTATGWERLSKDKIRKAYEVAIDSIPGAKESLAQDYKFENYERKKLITEDNPAPYVKGLTDKNGNVYTQEQWLNNKINNFADVAAYNHVKTSIDFGTALQNSRARQLNAAGLGGNTDVIDALERGFGSHIAGMKEADGNAFAQSQKTKSVTNTNALSIIRKYDKNFKGDTVSSFINRYKNKDGSVGPHMAFQRFIKDHPNMSYTDKIMLINNMVGYVAANKQFNDIVNKSKDRDAILFSANIANDEYTNDNKYGRAIIEKLNKLYDGNNNIKYVIGKDVMTNYFTAYNTTMDKLNNSGYNVSIDLDNPDRYIVSFDASHRNLLPRFDYEISQVESNTPGNAGTFIKKATSNVSDASFKIYDDKNNSVVNDHWWNAHATGVGLFSGIGPGSYKSGLEAAKKAEKEVGVSKGMITFNGFDYGSFAAMAMVDDPLAYGLDTDAKLQSAIKAAEDRVDNMFANTAIDMGNIEIIGDDNIAKKNIEYNRDARTLIQKMYRNETWRKANVKRTAYVPTGGGAGQPKGYIITVTVPDKQGVGHFKEGKTYRFVVSGSIEEGTKFDPSYNAGILADNNIITARATNSDIDILGVSKSLGNTVIRRNSKGEYETDFLNTPKKLNEAEATQLTKNMLRLQRLKYQIQAGVFDDDPNKRALANNSFEVLVKDIARITGKDIEVVDNELNNYINE